MDSLEDVKKFVMTTLGSSVLNVELTPESIEFAHKEAVAFAESSRATIHKNNWVKEYTLSRSLWTLGLTRSKFSSGIEQHGVRCSVSNESGIEIMKMAQDQMNLLKKMVDSRYDV
jgi:hypothetical protein